MKLEHQLIFLFQQIPSGWNICKTKRVAANDRINLLGNRLVLITPKGQSLNIKLDKTTDPNRVFTGKICTGDTKSVPVGKYAKQAFTNLGWWNRIEPKLVETEDVRAALNFVARGECQVGIVYATDAAISKDVKVAGIFPENTHSPIIYPLGLIKRIRAQQSSINFTKQPSQSCL